MVVDVPVDIHTLEFYSDGESSSDRYNVGQGHNILNADSPCNVFSNSSPISINILSAANIKSSKLAGNF
jgi:hypothetical protein